jgi:hypothetical protein
MNGSEDLRLLLQAISDPGKFAAKLSELEAREQAAFAKEQAAIEQEVVADRRLAEADKREAALRDAELEAHQEKQRLTGIRQELVSFAKRIKESEDQVKGRILRHAGLLDGLLAIQDLPSWSQIDVALGLAKPADVHFDSDDQNAVAAPQPVDHAPAGSTLTRTRRAMRRGEATA